MTYLNLAQFGELTLELLAKHFENQNIYSNRAKLIHIIKLDGSLHPVCSILPDLIRELGQANPNFGEGLLVMSCNTRSLPAGDYGALGIKVHYSTSNSRDYVFMSNTCSKIIYLPRIMDSSQTIITQSHESCSGECCFLLSNMRLLGK